MVNTIKYAVWGTKRGAQIFFHSEDLDVKSTEIENTLKDVRKYFKPKSTTSENYYAIEYTSKYLVYTIYYFLYDWANRDGFLAITIFIPKSQQLDQPVASLKKLFEEYKKNYIETNHRIKDVRERPSKFDEIVSSFRTQPANYDITTSPQNRKYGVEYFNKDEELEDFFTDPIRKEYFEYQEVLFLPESLRKDYQSLTPLNGTAKREYNLEITLKGHEEKSLSPVGLNVYINKNTNNEWKVANMPSIFRLSYQDQIEILLQKERYEKFTKKYKVGDLADSKEHCVDGKTIKLKEKIEPIKKNYTITLVSADGRKRIKRFKYRRNEQELSTSNPLNLENVLLLAGEKVTISAKGYKKESVTLDDKTDIVVSLQPIVMHKKSDVGTNEPSNTKFEKMKPYIVFGLIGLLLISLAFIIYRGLSSTPTTTGPADGTTELHSPEIQKNNLKENKNGKKAKSNVEIDSVNSSEGEELIKKTNTSSDQSQAANYQLELETIIDFSETTKWSNASSNIDKLESLKDKQLDFTKMNSGNYSSNDYDGLLTRLKVMQKVNRMINSSELQGVKNKEIKKIYNATKLSKNQNSELQAYIKK